ncbi:hypothetical protein IW150_005108 [Coemansia sp. RSA 2607]|nr:hypothetical protein IW150_005108 [Coemansia sp. RSA 2607]
MLITKTKTRTSAESSTARNCIGKSILSAYSCIRCLNCCISTEQHADEAEENTSKTEHNDKTTSNSIKETADITNPPAPTNEAKDNSNSDTIKQADKNQDKPPSRPPSIIPPPITRMFLVQPHVTPDQKWAAEETIYKVYSVPYRFPLWSSMTLDEQVYFTVAKEDNIIENMRQDDNYLLNKVITLHDEQAKSSTKS